MPATWPDPPADFDYAEDDAEDDYDPGEECGRWVSGRLGQQCTQAGTEFCDWDCPYSH